MIRSSHGTDRSSIFVTLCILVQQLRLEKKVDCCTVVRKLRSQRSQFLNSYVSDSSDLTNRIYSFIYVFSLFQIFQAQYEFVHRAIANYADLHKSDLDTSPSPSVRTNSWIDFNSSNFHETHDHHTEIQTRQWKWMFSLVIKNIIESYGSRKK